MKPKTKKIDILGTTYDFVLSSHENDPYFEKLECDGHTDYTVKKISVLDKLQGSLDDLEYQKRRLIRHEILHAFLYESGLSAESYNEQMVEWMAIQFPKIIKIFEQTDAL